MKKLSLIMVMMMAIMPFGAAADDYVRGDVDQDGTVGISDVTSLVDYLLAGVWPDDQHNDGYWIVITENDGTEKYIELISWMNENLIVTSSLNDLNNSLSVYPFHYRINGVDYGAVEDMTEAVLGYAEANPLVPGKNNYYVHESLSIGFGLLMNYETHNYFAYVIKGCPAHP